MYSLTLCGLGAKDGGAHSLRLATFQTLFLPLALCHGVRPLGVIDVFTVRTNPKRGQGMESRTGPDKWVKHQHPPLEQAGKVESG